MSARLYLLSFFICTTTVGIARAQSPRSVEYCGDCHRAIEEGWKQSVHSQAVESRLFQDALKMAQHDFGAPARTTCLGCHSPTAVEVGDLGLVRKVSWEGVTCDYCHSIRSITLGAANPAVLVKYTNVKSGPWQGITSPAHGIEYSAIHTTSLVCVGCHQYQNSLGFPVLTTYSEWKQSPYAAEQKDCQACHMYRVEGMVVDPRVKKTADQGINFHEMPGSHSISQLNKAIRGWLQVTHEGGQLRVEVDVTNQGAGHMVPTGSPLRRLVLEVRAIPYSGKQYREERVFTRTVAGRNGVALNREDRVFLQAAKVLSDTRLAPGETKKEVFNFQVPQGVRSQVQANLFYYYSPTATTKAQQEVKFLSMERLVD